MCIRDSSNVGPGTCTNYASAAFSKAIPSALRNPGGVDITPAPRPGLILPNPLPCSKIRLFSLRSGLRHLRRIGLAVLLLSGAVLFWLQPAQYYRSTSFREIGSDRFTD